MSLPAQSQRVPCRAESGGNFNGDAKLIELEEQVDRRQLVSKNTLLAAKLPDGPQTGS
jgi:hypothetical protein